MVFLRHNHQDCTLNPLKRMTLGYILVLKTTMNIKVLLGVYCTPPRHAGLTWHILLEHLLDSCMHQDLSIRALQNTACAISNILRITD
jgi:hypothetical protein